jgi:hypothetical protein
VQLLVVHCSKKGPASSIRTLQLLLSSCSAEYMCVLGLVTLNLNLMDLELLLTHGSLSKMNSIEGGKLT